MSNILNFYANIELNLSNYNIFIGQNGTGKSNLAKTIFQIASTPANAGAVPLIPFRGNRTAESSIEMSIDLDEFDLNSLKTRTDIQFLYKSGELAKLLSLNNLLKLSNITIVRENALRSNLFRIEGLPAPVGPPQKSIYDRFNYFLSDELRKKATFIPDTRDMPVSFIYDNNFENNPLTIDNFPTFLTDMKLNRRQSYDKLVEMYKRIIPYVKDLNINPTSNQLSLVEEVDEFKIPTFSISKGTRELVVVLSVLALCSNGTSVFIEEPEIHLHPSAIGKLRDVIRETAKSKNLQITITTHSSSFLSGLEPELDKDVQIYLFNREMNGESTVKHITTDSDFEKCYNSLNDKH